MPDNGQQIPAQPVTPAPQDTKPKQSDYFGLKLFGLSDDKIYNNAKGTYRDIVLLDKKSAWGKYGKQGVQSGAWKDEKGFDDNYNNISNAYNNYKKYSDIQGTSVPSGGDETMYESHGLWGPKPVQVRTKQMAAFNKGYYIDDTTGKKGKIDDISIGNNVYVKDNEEGQPEYHKGSMYDRLKSDQPVSWMGPSYMNSSWTSKLLFSMTNALSDIPSYGGGLVRMAGDASTMLMNGFSGKGFKSDSELNDKWNQPAYAKAANLMENLSSHSTYKAEDMDNSLAYSTLNMMTQLFAISKLGKLSGDAGTALGLKEGESVVLANHIAQAAGAGMVTEGFLKQANDMGIPEGKAALMSLGIFGASHFLLGKFGPNAAFNAYGKLIGEGTLKKSIQKGIDEELSTMAEKDIAKIPDTGWKRIGKNISEGIAKTMDILNAGKSTAASLVEGGLKGGADFGAFTLMQNAVETIYDQYAKSNDPNLQQGEGLFFKKYASLTDDLFTGVGESILMGGISSGLMSGADHIINEARNKGMSSEMRARYMEKEIVEGRYDGLVELIKKEGAKGTWGQKGIDKDGNAIKVGEDKQDINSVNTGMLLQQAGMLKDFYEKSGITNPKFIEDKLGGNKGLQLEALRNIRKTKNLEASIAEETKKREEEKKAGKDVVRGEDKLPKWNSELQELKGEYTDIISGKRASEKLKDAMIKTHFEKEPESIPQFKSKVNPFSYDAKKIDQVVSDIRNGQGEEEKAIQKRNDDSQNIRIGIKNFANELLTYDGGLEGGFMTRLDNTINNIEKLGIDDKGSIKKIQSFVKNKIVGIREFDETKAEDTQPTPERENELNTRNKLQEYNEKLNNKENLIPKPEVYNRDKFVNDYLFKNHNVSGEDVKNNIERLYKIAVSGTEDEKKQLSDNELIKNGGKLDLYSDDIESAKHISTLLGDVYSKLDEKHTGISKGDNMTEVQKNDIHNTANDLKQKLGDIKEASKKAEADKANAQNKLRFSKLQHSHYMLKAMSDILNLDDNTVKALNQADQKLEEQDKMKVSDRSRDINYKQDLLNEAEKQLAIAESSAHKVLIDDKSYKKHTAIIEKLLDKLWYDSYRTPSESNKGFESIFNKEFLSLPNDQLNDEQRKYKVVYTLNYLNQLTNIDSADFYKSLDKVVKRYDDKFPSYEQTDIKQVVSFLVNPHNGFITEWDKIRSKNSNSDLKKEIENPPHIDNAISLQGYAGVGKTTVVLPLALEVYREMTRLGDNNPTLLIGPNDEHLKSLASSVKTVNRDGNLKSMTTGDLVELARKDGKLEIPYHFIIMDEGSMLGIDDVAKVNELIKRNNSTARVIFLLDQFQGSKEESYSHLPVLENTQRSMPLTVNYRTASRDVQNLSDALRKSVMINGGDGKVEFPESHHAEDRSFGTEYFSNDDNLLKSFVEEANKAKDGKLPWLIVKDEKKRLSVFRDQLMKMPELKDSELLLQHIKTIAGDDLSNTAQGRQNQKIFILLDKGDFTGGSGLMNPYARFLYTAVSRVGNGVEGKEGYAGMYVNPKQFTAVNGTDKPIASSGMTIDRSELSTRLDHINSAFPEKEKEAPKQDIKKGDIVYRKNGINFISGDGQSWKDAKVISIKDNGNVVTDKGEFDTNDLNIKQGTDIPVNELQREYRSPDINIVSDKEPVLEELPESEAKFKKAAVDFDKEKMLRVNTHSIPEEVLSSLGNRLMEESPELTIKHIPERGGFKNVFEIYDDKGTLLGTTHSIEVNFNEDRNKRVLENIDYGKQEDIKNAESRINNSFKGDKYEAVLKQIQLARLNEHQEVIKNGGTLKVSVKKVTPGGLKFYEKGIKKPLANLIDNSKKNLVWGEVKQATNDDGITGMSVEVKPSSDWKGKSLEVFVYTDTINKDDIDNIKKNLEESEVEAGNNYNKLDQEAIHTLDLNRSILIKNFDKVKDFLIVKNSRDVFPKGDNISDQVNNLKRFYDYVNKNEELRSQLHTWIGINKSADGTFTLDKDNPNFKRLLTHVVDITPPELFYKYDSQGMKGEEKRMDFTSARENSGRVNPVSENDNVLYSEEEPVSEPVKTDKQSVEDRNKIKGNIKDYASLVHIFNNMSIVNKIRPEIQHEIGINRANNIVDSNGRVSKFKTLYEKIQDYKDRLKREYDKVPSDIQNKILSKQVNNDNLLTVGSDEFNGYILHNLLQDDILNKYIQDIHPDMNIKKLLKNEDAKINPGGDSKKQQENNKHNVDKDRSSILNNAIESTRYREYSADENGNVRIIRSTDKYVFGKELTEGIKNAGAWSERILEGQDGMTKDERFIDNLKRAAKEFTNEDGSLTPKGNAIQSFIDDFFKVSDKPSDYSYKYIQENKADILKKFPGLEGNEDFEKHYSQVSDLMNALYSHMTSNTQSNYSWLEHTKRAGSSLWKYISRSANPADEIKQKIKDTSDFKIAEYVGDDSTGKPIYNLSYAIRKNFSGGDKNISVSRVRVSKEGKTIVNIDSTNPARLTFKLSPDVTTDEIKGLFRDMGINLSSDAIRMFNQEGVSKKEINYTKQRLANIIGTFSLAIKGLSDISLRNEIGTGIDNLLARAGRGSISELSKSLQGPLPSDFVSYMDNLAEAEHSATTDAYNKRVVDVKQERIESIKPASYITKRLGDGGKTLQNEFNSIKKNVLTNPQLLDIVKNNPHFDIDEQGNITTKNQVLNGKLTWSKLEFVNGIKKELGKGNKFGSDATDLDVLNIAMNSFLEDVKSKNKYSTYHILGEPRADSTVIEMLPIQVEGGKKLIGEEGWTKDGFDYLHNSLADIFEHTSKEFKVSAAKWAPYLGFTQEEWDTITPVTLEEKLNSKLNLLSDKQKADIAFKIDNDNNFIKNKDVIIKWDYKKKGILDAEGNITEERLIQDKKTGEPIKVLKEIRLGHATTFNKGIDSMFNWEQYNKIQESLNAFMPMDEAMKEFYTPFINNMVSGIKAKGYKGNDSLLGAYSLLREVAHRNIYPLLYGDKNQYKDYVSYQKYIKESPGQSGRIGVHGQPDRVNTATIPDIDNATKQGMVNVTDGTQYIHPFYYPMFKKSFGGDMGVLGNGTLKLRTKYTDMLTGIAKDLKCATMQIKPETLDMSSTVGYEWLQNKHTPFEDILRLTTSDNLYNQFTELRKSMGTEKAMDEMAKRLQDNPELHKEIVHFLQHQSVVKTGQKSSNMAARTFNELQMDNLESEHILHQLNTDEDPDENSELLSKQLISTLAILPHNKEIIENINKAQLEKAKETLKYINKVIGFDATNPENRDKFHSYLKDIAKVNTKDIGDVQMFVQAFSNPDISLDITALGNVAKRVFIKQINKGIKTEASGTRNVKGDTYYFRKTLGSDGNYYTLRDIKKMGQEEATKLGLNNTPDEQYQDMRYEGNDMHPSETIGTYTHTKRFGIRPGEDINDVTTIRYKDGSFINTRNMDETQLESLLRDIWDMPESFEKVDIENTSMFREGMKKEKTEDLEPKELISKTLNISEQQLQAEVKKYIDQVLNYRKEFDKSLLGLSVRTPSSSPGSATPTKLASILHTYPSVEFSNGERNLRDGADYDIDEYANYGYNRENTKADTENNNILDNMLKFYGDIKNKDLIFSPIDISKYTDKIEKSNKTGLAKSLESYKTNNDGKQVIGIEAIANKAYSFLYQALENKKGLVTGLRISADGKDDYGQYISKNISDVMQMAVDNPKYGVLGANGVDEESVKVLNAILMSPGKVEGFNSKIDEGFAFLKQSHIKAIYDKLKNSRSIGETRERLPEIINSQLKGIDSFIQANYNMLTPDVQSPEVIQALKEQSDLDLLQKLEKLGDGFARFHSIFKIDSKAIESNDYDRTRDMSGPYGLEFVLNAPADIIFSDKYDEFQKSNPEWYMDKATLPYVKTYMQDGSLNPECEYAKALTREREIRSLFDYKGVFDNLPLIREYWEQHHIADTYLKENFLNGSIYDSIDKDIKKSMGYNDWFGSDQYFLSRKEFDKWTTSVYYNSEFNNKIHDIQSFGKDNLEKNRYSLSTLEGRKRFSGEAVEWLKGLKDKVKNNKALNELVITTRGGKDNIELKSGNKYSDDVMVELQQEMNKLKALKTVFSTTENPLSVYDILHHYSVINDSFFTGGNSLTKLFGMEGILDYSKWLEGTLQPSIKENRDLCLYDSEGNEVRKSFIESLETYKKDMPVQVDKKLRQNDNPKNKGRWSDDANTKPDYYNSTTKVGFTRVDVVKDKVNDIILNTGDSKYGYNPAQESSVKFDDKTQYIPIIPRDLGERLLAGESVIYDNPSDIPLKIGKVKLGDYGDGVITRVAGGKIELNLPNHDKGMALVRSDEEGIHTPTTAQQELYMKPAPEGKSDIQHFLDITKSYDINDGAYRKIADHYSSSPILDKVKNIKVVLTDLKDDKIAKSHQLNTGTKVNGYYHAGKIFIDKNSNIPKTFMHEFHHAILSDVMKSPVTERDKQFKHDITELYRHAKLRSAIGGESHYGLKNVDEFIAEGFSNPKFQKYLMGISSPDNSKSVWRKVLDHIADYFTNIFGINKGELKGTLLNDLFAATHEYLKGGIEEGNKADGVMFSVEDDPKDNILNIRSKILDTPVVSHESMSADKIREVIFKRPLTEDNYYYINNNKNDKILIPANSSHSFIDSKIKEIQELQSDFSGELKDKFISSLNTGDFNYMGKRKDGTDWFNKDTINSIYEITGADIKNGDKVMKLSELKAEGINISENFIGNDPMVIVHNTQFSDLVQKDIEHKPVVELTLIDMTRKGLTPGTQNIFSKYRKGGATNLTASERGMRNLQLALTAMKLREGNENIRFRKVGVMQALKDTIHYSFDAHLNPQDFLKEFKKFLVTAQGKEFLNAMPEGIQSMLKDPANNPLLSKDYGQSYMWQLKTDWEKQMGTPGMRTSDKYKLKDGVQRLFDFQNGNREVGRDLLKMMKERQRVLKNISNEDKGKEWRKEMNDLTHSIYDLETSSITKYGTIKDISASTLWGSTESNVGHPIIDYITTAKDRANRYIAKTTLEFKDSILRKPIEKLLDLYPESQLLSRGKEQASVIFDKCLKKVDATEKEYDDKGKEVGENKVRINSKMVHHDINDEDTKKAISSGETTKEHVEFGKLVADQVWNILMDAKKHELRMSNNGQFDLDTEFGKEKLNKQAEDEIKATWEYGMIPTMKKSSGEKWFGIDFKKFKDKIANPNVDVPDLLGDKSGEISNYFLNQLGTTKGLGNADVTGKLMGVSVDQAGNWVLNDRKANQDVSADMEQILTALKMTTLRKERFDNDVIPAYDNARRIVDEMKLHSGIEGSYKNLERFIDESYLAGIKQDTHKTDPDTMLGKLENKAMLLRSLSGNASTAWNMGILATIAVTNPMIAFIKSVANTMGGSHLFHTTDLVKAAGKLTGQRKLLNAMGEMYQVMSMSPKDIAGNPQKQILKKSFFKSFYMHWPVYTLDYATREWLMAAQMIRDGKFDAHTLNESTGKIQYDEKKDRQFWNEDGTQSEKQRLMRKATRDGLIKDGWMTETDTKLPKAYSLDTGERALKDISDQVIYDMGNTSHINLQNFEMGRQIYQFKPFTGGQIEQAWSAPYERLASGQMVITKDEYGNDVAKLQPQDYEGSIRTWAYAIKELLLLKQKPKEFWDNLTPKQKHNIVALVGDVMLFSGLAMIYNKDDDKKKKHQIAGRTVKGNRLLESIKTSSFDLVNPYYPGFWVNSLTGKNILPSVVFAAEAGMSAWHFVHADFGKALESFPVAKSDVKIIEQAVGYKPETKHKKQVVE